MYRALACLAFEHNHALVALAAAICIIGAVTCLRVLQVSFRSEGVQRFAWLAAAAVAGGGSVWATHFIAMIAYDPGVVVGYSAWPIFSSFAAAVVLPGAGFTMYLLDKKWVPLGAGVLVGLGIAALHYVGMTGVIVPARMEWDAGLVVASIIFSCVFAMASLYLLQRIKGAAGEYAGAAALVTGVVTLHFTGMGALTILPDPAIPEPAAQLSTIMLASGAMVVTTFILAIASVCIAFDRRMSRDHEETARRIRHMAYHDALTGLPNRALLAETLPERLAEAATRGEEVAILAIDLDRFKQVNDIFGHRAGDALLCRITSIIQDLLGPSDILARIGGDEFVIVQSGVQQPQGAENLAEKLLDAVCRKIDVGSGVFRAAASVGIAIYPRDGHDADTLRPNADAALYRAKREGGGALRFFAADMDLALRERRALQTEISDALKRDEFQLYYQPQAQTRTGVISGFEALVRWEHPELGLVSPAHFITAAEENGLIVELGEFVLRTACTEAASWGAPLNVSVNLSPVQFQHGDLVSLVADVLAKTGLDPKRLELEITENVLIHDTRHALGILSRIKKLGVRVAMDDFGTGYSSLAYLQAFPFDRIKIDRSFISALSENTQSRAIIRAIVGLGHGLEVPVTAEGVETEMQHAFLAELDCAEVQGYLIGRPQPIELLEMHVRRTPGAARGKAVA